MQQIPLTDCLGMSDLYFSVPFYLTVFWTQRSDIDWRPPGKTKSEGGGEREGGRERERGRAMTERRIWRDSRGESDALSLFSSRFSIAFILSRAEYEAYTCELERVSLAEPRFGARLIRGPMFVLNKIHTSALFIYYEDLIFMALEITLNIPNHPLESS
jgi:hypothetical protein